SGTSSTGLLLATGDLQISGSLHGDGALQASAATITNTGSITAGNGDLTLSATSVSNSAQISAAAGNVNINASSLTNIGAISAGSIITDSHGLVTSVAPGNIVITGINGLAMTGQAQAGSLSAYGGTVQLGATSGSVALFNDQNVIGSLNIQ